MPYEMNREDVFGLAAATGAETKQKGDELFWKWCPYCHGGEHQDKDTFSVNLETGTFKCFRVGCGKQGHFVELARDFRYPLDFGNGKRQLEYKQLPQRPITVRDGAVAYMAKRGISREVVERYKITTQKDNSKILAFPFYDADGILQFVKYRNTAYQKGRDKNKEWCERDTKPILFGMWQCKDFGELVITEGQIDSLTLAECGIANAVSVPTGAKGFTWVTHCWDWLMKFESVVVFGDYENGTVTLVSELSKRLPKLKVVQEQYYLGEKDANAILQKYGKQAVVEAVNSAEIQPIKRIKQLADVKKIDTSTLPRVRTNISEIDRIIGGIFFGQVALLTGKRGEGKSTFMSQIVAEALEQGHKVLAYSGELTDYQFRNWLDMQLAGGHNIKTSQNQFGDDVYTLPSETADRIAEWYRNSAYIYDNNAIDNEDEFEGILDTVERGIQRYGINFVCIDNLMTALDVDIKDDLYRSQSKFVQRLKKIATKYDVAVLLVAHPKKTQGDFSNDDVSGSGDITNRVDVVMSYSRPKDDDVDHDGELIITKNRLTGILVWPKDPIRLSYSKKSRRITSARYGEPLRRYAWESQQWVDLDDGVQLPF